MTRVAALDCGTNSARLLIADLPAATTSDGPGLVDVVRRLEINRLGEGVDRTGRLAPAALDRTRLILADYAGEIERHGVTGIRVVATSATRDAENRDEFVSLVRELLGVVPEVVSGGEEAELTFTGAMRSLTPAPPGPVLACDIGGGSTELVRGDADGVTAAYSMDIGSVRLTERRLLADPPTPGQITAAATDVEAALTEASAHVSLTGHTTFLGLAGTVTTTAALVLGLTSYVDLATHGAEMTRDQVEECAKRLLSMTHDERAAEPVIHPGRVDVIGAGALILREILRRTGSSRVLVSEHDILDGIAWSILDR